MLSSSKLTRSGEMVMPCPFDQLTPLCHHGGQVAEGAGIQPLAFRDSDLGPEPEFRFAAVAMTWIWAGSRGLPSFK
jgi:hypothetical protein